MKRDTTERALGASEEGLFDNWFDPIEAALRSRVRGFLEAIMEEELASALGRCRYGRRSADEADQSVVGHRHGRRTRKLTGTFGETEIAVPRARLVFVDMYGLARHPFS